MERMQMINLGDLYRTAESVKGARTRNQLADLALQNEPTRIQNQNRLADLVVQGKEQAGQLNEFNITDAQRGQAAHEAKLFLDTLGSDFADLEPQAQQQRWMAARQQQVQFDPEDDAHIPQQYDAGFMQQIQGLAQQAGAGKNNGVQSTFTTQDGKLGYVTRDGRTVVTDQDVQRSYQVRDYGDQPFVFDSKTGAIMPVGGAAGAATESAAERQRQAEIEQERQKALAKEEAKAEAAQGAQARESGQVLGKLDQMEQLVRNGVYGGGILDRAGRMAAGAGVPFDEGKAARTQQLRQLATELKLQAKPPGMGSMSDSEWQILKEAIPNPDAGTPEQILAGIEQFRQTVRSRMQQPAQSGAQRFRYNPQTGDLEPVQ